MPVFEDYFRKSRGKPISYKGKILYMADQFAIGAEAKILIRRVSTNSEWRQGIGLDIRGKFIYREQEAKNKAAFWSDTSPKEITLRVESKDGILKVKNLWDCGNGVVEAWHNGAAMIIEEIANGRRYYCNDGHPDENFDDIVFEIIVLTEGNTQ